MKKLIYLILMFPTLCFGAEKTIADLDANDITTHHLLQSIQTETQSIGKYAKMFADAADAHSNMLILIAVIGVLNIGLLIYLILLIKKKSA